MLYVVAWLRAFLLTVGVELLVAGFLLRRYEPSLPRRAGLIFFAQMASHPAVWFLFPELRMGSENTLILSESWAVCSEMLFYTLAFQGLGGRRALGTAALANGASYGVGLLLHRLALGG
ncbi:MAG: hypothetical protein RMJ98_07240 [Myxococcales bacterium]|nr:hypothetical protein [Polyangiaceae bacterium]MDW8249080.1 hypothetical protein [Myxococcales bacterium]